MDLLEFLVDVPTSDYYKLLDTSLPEPHRMKQLLIWSFKKKLDQEEKLSRSKSKSETTEDQTIINIAKVIKEEVFKIDRGPNFHKLV